MKSNQLILTVCFFFALLIGAQAQKLQVSPKVGVNASGLSYELQNINTETEARVGFNAGVDFRIGEGFLQLHPGAHYYSFTADLMRTDNQDINFEEQTTIQQLKLPLNIGLNLTGDGGLLGLYIKGGITPSILLSVTERDNFDISADDINTFILGSNVGVGVDLFSFLTVEANYEIGMTDFFKDAGGRNNVFTLSAGLVF